MTKYSLFVHFYNSFLKCINLIDIANLCNVPTSNSHDVIITVKTDKVVMTYYIIIITYVQKGFNGSLSLLLNLL